MDIINVFFVIYLSLCVYIYGVYKKFHFHGIISQKIDKSK